MKKRAFIFMSAIIFTFTSVLGCSPLKDDTAGSMDISTIDSSVTQSSSSSENASSETVSSNESPSTPHANPIDSEFNAVWFSYFELSDMVKGKTEQQFREKIKVAYKNVADLGLDAVIMHVRPSSDAFYESDIFPWSMYCSGTQGVSPGFDPLEIMVEEAHALDLQIHAWINPLRVCSEKNFDSLAASNPAKIWLSDNIKENDSWVKKSGGYYYNPTVKEVRQLIIDGVVEIIRKYDIDGFQFDDYFYPTTDAQFDQEQYNEYMTTAGQNRMNRTLWRLDQVNKLVKDVYDAIKAEDESIIFGISPTSNIDTNTDVLYADIYTWMSTPGYIDYICPQIYFGFEHSTVEAQYQNRLAQWSAIEKSDEVKLLIGLASYKIGTQDGGSDEWISDGNIMKKQIEVGRSNDKVGGFLFYSYTYLFGSKQSQKTELKNINGMF